jgi:hypothetical protein
MMRKTILMMVVVLMVGILNVSCTSSKEVAEPMEAVIQADARNTGVGMTAYYGESKAVLVLDMKSIGGDKSPADVFRVLLQYASRVKDKTFERVELACKETTKFFIKGDYFRTLGVEYGTQNPIYTMRTFPENVYKPDGSRAFSSWTGGVLGVTGKQMEDFSAFHKQWYITALFQ